MKKIVLVKIILIAILIIFLIMGNVKAAYQSTPNTHANPATKTWDTWLSEMRKMEATGGAFGLTETLNGTTATSESNNIDVHMMKATEYGAIAILSASGYGNLNNTQKPETSTADTAEENKTGVFYNYNNWEFTACIAAEEVGNSFSRYWDKYNTLSLIGLSPSQTWHGGSAGNSLDTSPTFTRVWYDGKFGWVISGERSSQVGFYRTVLSIGYNGLFSYNFGSKKSGYTKGSYAYNNWGGLWYTVNEAIESSFYARGAIVNMTGI